MSDSAFPLHVEQHGHGPDLVLLHGWGMHSAIWQNVVESLQTRYRLHLVDLPGHGQSQNVSVEFDLQSLAGLIWQSVSPGLSGPASILGWSLGGLAAMQIALEHPRQIRALVLVASTPRFTRADNWPHAMAPSVLEAFAVQLAGDHRATLQRFLALQVKGSDDARNALRELRRRVLDNAGVDPMALQSGLRILQQADLRAQLGELAGMSVLWIYGEQDRLVPVEVRNEKILQATNMQSVVMEGAGHAPFISQTQTFVKHIKAFLDATG